MRTNASMRLLGTWSVAWLVATGCGAAPARTPPRGEAHGVDVRPATLSAKQLWSVNPPLYLGDSIDGGSITPELVLLHRQ